MKKTPLIIAFCLLGGISVFGNDNFFGKDIFLSDRCANKLTWFCFYGNINYSTSGSLSDNLSSIEDKVLTNDKALSSNTKKLATLSLLYLYSENYSNLKIEPIVSKIKKTNDGYPSSSYKLLANKVLMKTFHEYTLQAYLRQVDMGSVGFPFYELRFEGFGVRLRI